MAGWIKLWDIPEDHWLNSDIRYFGMWVKLIRKAETKNRKIVRNGVMIDAKRGTVYSSVNQMAREWGVTRRTVEHFLHLCESDGMITVQRAGNAGSNVIVNNYAKYQDKPNNGRATDSTTNDTTDGTTDSTTDGTTDSTTKATSFLTNTEGKEGIEGKKDRVHRTFVPPTISDIVQYAKENGLQIDAERFWNYYESIGWKVGGKSHMKNWQAAVRNWSAKQTDEKPKPKAKKFDNFEPRPDGDLMDDLIKQLEARYGT